MKATGSGEPIRQLDRAYQAAGRQEQELRQLGAAFQAKLDGVAPPSTWAFKLKMAVSSTTQAAMSELFRIAADGGAGLSQWMKANPDALGWMPAKMFDRLTAQASQVDRVGQAVADAKSAIDAAFGPRAKAPEAEAALGKLEGAAKADGRFQASVSAEIRGALRTRDAFFAPGSRRAVDRLANLLSDPRLSQTQRADKYTEWKMQNPLANDALDPAKLGAVLDRLSRAPETDADYRGAHKEARAALGLPEKPAQ